MYARLGNICKTGSMSITSNTKFYSPNDPIYLKKEEKNYAISKDDIQGSYESKDTIPNILPQNTDNQKCCGN
jgi:hypothetical protein